MAPMPVPPHDGGDDRISGRPQGLRLSDAEEIAARRLDGAAEGSLREALAVASARSTGDAGSLPTDAVGQTGESLAFGPLVRLISERSAEIGRAQAPKPLDTLSHMPMPPALDVHIPLVTPAPPAFAVRQFADEGGPAFVPSEDRQGIAREAPPAPAMAPLLEAAIAPSMEPLTSALDAAVQLAADANVAAEALENLRRLLEHKQQLESRLPHLAAGPAPAPASDNADTSATAPALPPLPLPLHAEQGAAGGSSNTVLPPPPRRRRRAPPERRVFDLRGFMAGFALSWAFGVVLYLFMTAG
jgi:hypothetical protein